jgi:MFS family permease
MLFGLSHQLYFSLPLMALIGFSMAQCLSITNTLLQTLVPDDKRARVMSYYTMAFFGMVPFGSLFAGALADRVGAAPTVMFTGACVLFAITLNQLARRANWTSRRLVQSR